MEVPITTAAPVEALGTSVIKDLDGNLIIKKGDLPPMTIRQGTVAPDTWAALSAKAAPMPTPADVGVVPEVPGMPPGVPLPAQNPIKYGSPTFAPPQNPALQTAPVAVPAAQAKPFDPMSLVGVNPKIAAMQERAIADQKKANNEMAGLQEQRALEESQAQRKANAAIDKVVADSQTQRDYLMNRYELEERARADAVEQHAKMKVDPNRLLSSRSTSEEVKWGLAAFFGGIGAALTGGPNMAVEALNRAIDQDIDAQKNAIANAKDTVNMRTNTVAQMKQKITDFDQAVMAAKQVQLERAKRAVDILATEYGGPEAKARAMALNAGLDAKLAELRDQQDAHAKARMVQLLDKMPLPGGKALNEGTAKELGEANSATQSAQDLLNRFNGNADGVGGWLMSFLPLTDASKYEDRARAATQVIGSYLEGGKLSDANVPQYRAMLPKPGESPATARNKIDAIVQLVAARQSAQKAALAGSGYNVTGIKDAAPKINFKPTGQ